MSVRLISWIAHSGFRPSEHKLVTLAPSIDAVEHPETGISCFAVKRVPKQSCRMKNFKRPDGGRCITPFEQDDRHVQHVVPKFCGRIGAPSTYRVRLLSHALGAGKNAVPHGTAQC